MTGGPRAESGERIRIGFLFGLMGVAVVGVGVRLGQLQLVGQGASAARAASMVTKDEDLPAARCRIVDRKGRVLAYDRPVHAAQGEVYFRLDRQSGTTVPEFERQRDAVVVRVLRAILRDPTVRAEASSAEWRRRLRHRLDRGCAYALERLRARREEAAANGGEVARQKRLKIDLPIHDALVDAGAILALQGLDLRRDRDARRRGYQLYMHVDRRFERVYEDRAATAGVVGAVADVFTPAGVRRIGATGLERLRIAREGDGGRREFRVDARMVPYWTARGAAAEAPLAMRTTIDLELQRSARRHLRETAVQSVFDHYGSPPEWAGILAVEIETGDVLAMASFTQARDAEGKPLETIRADENGAFAPTTCVFEPGSVVKPLVFALGLERGRIDWDRAVDCSHVDVPIGSGRRARVIRDTHRCGWLDPRGVLIESSNIGAVRLGMQLGPEGLDEYLDRFGFREGHGLPLPSRFREVPKSVRSMSWRDQNIWVGPSLCFGYAVQTTVAHVAGAYLSLLTGRTRRLRLVDALEYGGERRPVQAEDADSAPFLSRATIARVREAMQAMVAGAERATAPALTAMLDDLGVPRGFVGGKTGTAQFGPRDRMTRTASFVGFAPADAPRVLVVCVVQKFDAALFYGGKYAAPAAGRLLLDALGCAESRSGAGRTVGATQVSAWMPGVHAVRDR